MKYPAPSSRRLLHGALLASLLGFAPAVHAGNFVWTGILGEAWDEILIAPGLNLNNWDSNAVGLPNDNDTVLFRDALAYVVDLNGDRSVLSAAFAGANAYTLNNDTLTLLTGNLAATGTATHTINSNVALGADGEWDVDADLDLIGNLLGGAQTLELQGNGSIQLKGGANALDTLLLDGPSLTLSGTLTLAQDLRAVNSTASGLVTVTTGGDLMVGRTIDLDSIIFDMRIESGGQVSAGSVGVANGSQEQGDLTVTGSDGAGNRSTLDVTGLLSMGFGSPSITNLVISDGGLVTSGSGQVGGSYDDNTSSALAQVRGADGFGNHATWSIDNNLTVGGLDSPAEAILTISNDGVVTVGNRVTIEVNGEVELNGGVFTANRIDLEGTFNFTGGKLTVDTFNGDLLQQGGTLAAGTSPGVTNIDGNYELAGGALEFEFIDGLNPGTSWDAYNVTGNVDLTGGSLQALQLAAFAPSADLEMIFMTIDGTRTGTFAGLAQDDLVGTFTGTDLFITYQAGDGNDIALYSVPEPTSLALLGLGGLLATRRRRG